jgi:ABC-type ATPase with predicted acetyltransferase domain
MIELFGGRDVRSAMHLMGLVGLSDAFVYLKRFAELSNGQQYRAMLTCLIFGTSRSERECTSQLSAAKRVWV